MTLKSNDKIHWVACKTYGILPNRSVVWFRKFGLTPKRPTSNARWCANQTLCACGISNREWSQCQQ